jgi:predicted Zn-dependent protease
MLTSVYLFSSGCMVNPVTLDKEFNVISEQREIEMGRKADPQVLQQFGYYDDPALQRYVNEVGQKIVVVCLRKNIDYSFRVLDSPIENAFALPGGYIYITRGLLARLNSEAELAGVLGHEVGHVVGRDSANRMSESMWLQVAALAGMASGQTARELAVATSSLLNSIILGYGREKEFLADSQAVEYMFKAGYDPMQLGAFQRCMARMSQSPVGYSLYGSTHPDIFDRIGRSEAQAKVLLAMEGAMGKPGLPAFPKAAASSSPGTQSFPLSVLTDQYKDRLDGLSYGPNEDLRRIKIYTVQEGDTFSSVSQSLYGHPDKAKEIAEHNGLSVEMVLYSGQRLKWVY